MILTESCYWPLKTNAVKRNSSALLYDQPSFLTQSSMNGINALSSSLTSLNMKNFKCQINSQTSFPLQLTSLIGKLVIALILLSSFVLFLLVVVMMLIVSMAEPHVKSQLKMKPSWSALSQLICLITTIKKILRSTKTKNT